MYLSGHFVFAVLITLCVEILSTAKSSAQTTKNQAVDTTKEKSALRLGLSYVSDNYYMGRADISKAPYLTPSLGYLHKSGLFAIGSLSYLTVKNDERIDLYMLECGYDYYGKKSAFGLSISEYLFNDSSFVTQSQVSTYLNSYLGYDLTALILYLDASLGFSRNTDVFLGFEINRPIYYLKSRLRISPSFYINFGTQKYYNEYYTTQQIANGKGMGQQHSHTIQTTQISESEKFQILDYEIDMRISYKIHNIRLYLSSTWLFPVNPSKFVTNTGTYTENLENGFYWSTGLRLTLNSKKKSTANFKEKGKRERNGDR